MRGISKRFPGVLALDGVDLAVGRGEIVALIGENGAGKSTLIKIITGVYHKDEGEIRVAGEKTDIQSPIHAQQLGIGVIHQELSLCPYLSVAENMFMGNAPRRRPRFVVDWNGLRQRTEETLEKLKLAHLLDPRTPVSRLSVAQAQMVEIGKAISSDFRIILMDEPTSALTPQEVQTFFEIVKDLKNHGISIVFISHKLAEVLAICDRVTVLRDGHLVDTVPTSQVSTRDITTMMIGRSVVEFFAEDRRKEHEFGGSVLEVQGLNRGMVLKDLNLSVREGEILGIFGLMGAGRTECLRAIFGADKKDSGIIFVDGKQANIETTRDALRFGIGLLPEERKRHGIFPEMSVRDNITIANLRNIANFFGRIDKSAVKRDVEEFIESLDIRTPSADVKIKSLSGGNQQKVIVARWLSTKPKVLLLDEPTRGIDIGAKAEIHRLIRELAQQGLAVIMVSSELIEIMEMSDRIMVMREGQFVGEFTAEEATEEGIISLLSETDQAEEVEAATGAATGN
jgi:ribose transport system ATP-binding protein